jgi:hypothetical protein
MPAAPSSCRSSGSRTPRRRRSHRRASCTYPAVGLSSGIRARKYRLNRAISNSRTSFAAIEARAVGRCRSSAWVSKFTAIRPSRSRYRLAWFVRRSSFGALAREGLGDDVLVVQPPGLAVADDAHGPVRPPACPPRAAREGEQVGERRRGRLRLGPRRAHDLVEPVLRDRRTQRCTSRTPASPWRSRADSRRCAGTRCASPSGSARVAPVPGQAGDRAASASSRAASVAGNRVARTRRAPRARPARGACTGDASWCRWQLEFLGVGDRDAPSRAADLRHTALASCSHRSGAGSPSAPSRRCAKDGQADGHRAQHGAVARFVDAAVEDTHAQSVSPGRGGNSRITRTCADGPAVGAAPPTPRRDSAG